VSLIINALKKAQEKQNISSPANSILTPKKSVRQRYLLDILIIIVLAIIIGAIISTVFIKISTTNKEIPAKEKPASTKEEPQPSLVDTSKEALDKFKETFSDSSTKIKSIFQETTKSQVDSKKQKAAEKIKTAPTQPAPAPITNKKTLEKLSLSGIMWDKESPLAIINNKILKPGDYIGNAKITKIEKNSVTIAVADQEYKLSLE